MFYLLKESQVHFATRRLEYSLLKMGLVCWDFWHLREGVSSKIIAVVAVLVAHDTMFLPSFLKEYLPSNSTFSLCRMCSYVEKAKLLTNSVQFCQLGLSYIPYWLYDY